jgi:hypothetical protein
MESVAARDAETPTEPIPIDAVPAERPHARRRYVQHPYLALWVLSLVLAALSLRFPSTPNYDPWAWLIWGREIVHFHLSTTGGPTWKPLVMIFTTVFALSGSLAPDLWLIVARAGGFMALALIFTLAFRLTQALAATTGLAFPRTPATRARLVAAIPASLAGLLALTGLFVLSQYSYDVSLGYSEGLAVALTLLAILRHLDGVRRQAFMFGFAVALDRPEVWPFLLIYAALLWRDDPAARRWIAVLLTLLLPLWLLPDLVGSGSLIRGVQYAVYPRGPATSHCPFCTEITQREWPLLITPFKVGTIFLIAAAVMRLVRNHRLGRPRGPLGPYGLVGVILLLGITLGMEEATLTEVGASGNNRYLFLAVCLVIVIGSVGWAGGMAWLAHLLARAARPYIGTFAAAIVAVGGFVAISPASGSWLIHTGPTVGALRYQADLREDMPKAVREAGGAQALRACGEIETNPASAPQVAWTLDVAISQAQGLDGNVIIETRSGPNAPLEPDVPANGRFQLVASVRTVKIFTDCH